MANEKRLIDANALEEFLAEKRQQKSIACCDYYDGYGDAIDNVDDWIDAQPTVDAVETVHGRWLYDSGSGKYFCSACNADALSFKKDTLYGGDLYDVCLTDYCPNCGAKMMDGDGNG